MHKLCVKLPPFSPDYSGSCSALFNLGGMVVIHDAAGCTGNYTGFDEPRWYGSSSLVYCSALREIDAVLGDDAKLIRKLIDAAEQTRPKFIALLGSPVPMVIGTDLKGVAAELEATIGLPCLGFDTTGLNYYDKGAADAFVGLAKRFLKPQPKVRGSVNLLGATPLDFSLNGDIPAFKRLLADGGFQVLCDFAMHSQLEDLLQAPAAEVNLVLSGSGLPLARWMQERFGIPWVSGVPIGQAPLLNLWNRLAFPEQAGTAVPAQGKADRTLIVHDQIIANSLREHLRLDLGFGQVTVGTGFGFVPELAEPGDKQLNSEVAFKRELLAGYSTIIADPLFEQLLPANHNLRFIALPHVAVSSRLHWASTPRLAEINLLPDQAA